MTTTLTVIVILIALFIVWTIYSKMTWKQIMVGSDPISQEQIRKKYDQFQTSGIRSKLKTEARMESAQTADGLVSGQSHGSSTLLKLVVHRKDVEKMNAL
ncbi:hypothetical protein D3H55_16455 [Bacillus salacetis]|uniref:Uncharacterized protein n=1 Tax=Bacillus salacetis TaxID=2315464 RepID=A0A3A1QVR3_9BACI|nr:hypothetical protein [Bacillus salacetis]RIW30721.1 hypothetical protein D3H55_16455 [Bacillus salacetis]